MASLGNNDNKADEVYGFSFVNQMQEFVIPSTGVYKLECWGASGGIGYGNGNPFGKGGYACGEKEFSKGEVLYIYVGEDGKDTRLTPSFNGGGKSYNSNGHNGGRGGGASDIRYKGTGLDNRIIVAGGGGGAQSTCGISATAGHGGGLTGVTSYNQGYKTQDPAIAATRAYSTGGTQVSAGKGYNTNADEYNCISSGSFGLGADSVKCGGGGGGGWYGGGSGYTSGGGGGSSYIGDLDNALTIDGGSFMPNINDGNKNMQGKTGNGYVKITKLSYMNMQHYYIECDDKKYIPIKQFWNDNLNGFVPIEDYVIKDIENEAREFMLDINDLLKPIDIGGRTITPIDIFKNKKFKICKYVGFNKKWELEDLDNTNGLNKGVSLLYKNKKSILGQCFIKNFEYIRDFDFKKYDYKLKSDCPNIKIALFHNGEYYGKDFKVISKDDIINNGLDINRLNDIKIPFKNFKIIIVMTGNKHLNQIKLYKKLKPVSKLIDKKRYNIYYDNIQKRIYLIFNSNKIRKLTVNKLDKYQEPYGIINSLEDIKERT